MTGGFWAALIGYALGSAQVLAIDWVRNRAQHRRQLRLLNAELRRLSGFQETFGWQRGVLPKGDMVPNPPRITSGYSRLMQEIDFWLTDEHSDDNTQQGLIDISDGCGVLERYANSVLEHVDRADAAASAAEKAKWRDRAVDTALAYDKEHKRWRTIVASALKDVERRCSEATTWRQLVSAFRPMPIGSNPAPLPPGAQS